MGFGLRASCFPSTSCLISSASFSRSESCEKSFDVLQLLLSLLMLSLVLDNSTSEQLHFGEEHLGQSLERVQLTEDDAPKRAQLLL